MRTIPNYINGEFIESKASEFTEVINPFNEEILAKTPHSTDSEISNAIKVANEAFSTWSKTPVIDRVQPLFKLKGLLEDNAKEICEILTREHGKTYKESWGDLLRGIQMVEVATGMPSLMQGEALQDVARGIDSYAYRKPLGVFAGINPFNFPAMVPMWFWPFAVASGNCFIVKPSERVSMTQEAIFKLIDQCGFPPGVIQMVNGSKDVVNHLLESEDIKGISFVGSTPVAKYIYEKGCAHKKRVQALGGAKNFLVMTPDAQIEKSVQAMVDSCLGCAGERCLAGAVLVGIGDGYDKMKDEVLRAVKNIKVGDGLNPETTMGPVISMEAKARILQDIEQAKSEGAECIYAGESQETLDKGYFVAPHVFENVKPGSLLATKEIFGPVISLMKVDTLGEAIKLINSSDFANTCSIFTTNGMAAREFSQNVHPSMVGVNLGVPAPMAFFSFGGSKDSFYGDVKVHGKSSVEFFTEKLTVMQRWFNEDKNENLNPHWDND
tara:strand:+ start:6358 stop:7845 length:1488 start_codon:yes stop_codon:yes gene_type:complete